MSRRMICSTCKGRGVIPAPQWAERYEWPCPECGDCDADALALDTAAIDADRKAFAEQEK
jgi:hypothetical protein